MSSVDNQSPDPLKESVRRIAHAIETGGKEDPSDFEALEGVLNSFYYARKNEWKVICREEDEEHRRKEAFQMIWQWLITKRADGTSFLERGQMEAVKSCKSVLLFWLGTQMKDARKKAIQRVTTISCSGTTEEAEFQQLAANRNGQSKDSYDDWQPLDQQQEPSAAKEITELMARPPLSGPISAENAYQVASAVIGDLSKLLGTLKPERLVTIWDECRSFALWMGSREHKSSWRLKSDSSRSLNAKVVMDELGVSKKAAENARERPFREFAASVVQHAESPDMAWYYAILAQAIPFALVKLADPAGKELTPAYFKALMRAALGHV